MNYDDTLFEKLNFQRTLVDNSPTNCPKIASNYSLNPKLGEYLILYFRLMVDGRFVTLHTFNFPKYNLVWDAFKGPVCQI